MRSARRNAARGKLRERVLMIASEFALPSDLGPGPGPKHCNPSGVRPLCRPASNQGQGCVWNPSGPGTVGSRAMAATRSGGPPGESRRASRGSPPAGGACRVGRIEGTSPVCALAHEHTCTQSVVTIGRSRRTWSGFLDQVLRLAAIGELAPRGDISRTSLCSAHCAAVPVSRRAVSSKFRPFVPI